MALFYHFFFSAAVQGSHPNGNLLLRVYPARQQLTGSFPRKSLKAGQKTRPGWA